MHRADQRREDLRLVRDAIDGKKWFGSGFIASIILAAVERALGEPHAE